MEWTSIDLSSKLSVTCKGSVKCYKSVKIPIFTLPVEIGNTLAILKTSQQALFSIAKVYSLFGQTEGEWRDFFGGCKKGGLHCKITAISTRLSKNMKKSDLF